MTEKVLSQVTTLPKNPTKNPKYKNSKETGWNTAITEIHSIPATSPSQLAEDLKISLLALKNMDIRKGDIYAIEGWISATGTFESTIVQYRGSTIINKQPLLAEHDYRGNEWTPTSKLQVTLIRPTPTSNFEWKNQFSVPSHNITEFQLELARITDKISTHCTTREGLKELSAQCQVQGESGAYKVSVPKNAFQKLVFPSFWNQINLKGVHRLASLIEIAAPKENEVNKKSPPAVILAFLQESIDLTVSIQNLEQKIQTASDAYLVTQTIATPIKPSITLKNR